MAPGRGNTVEAIPAWPTRSTSRVSGGHESWTSWPHTITHPQHSASAWVQLSQEKNCEHGGYATPSQLWSIGIHASSHHLSTPYTVARSPRAINHSTCSCSCGPSGPAKQRTNNHRRQRTRTRMYACHQTGHGSQHRSGHDILVGQHATASGTHAAHCVAGAHRSGCPFRTVMPLPEHVSPIKSQTSSSTQYLSRVVIKPSRVRHSVTEHTHDTAYWQHGDVTQAEQSL